MLVVRWIKFLILSFLICQYSCVFANFKIIRDTEIETVLYEIASPILKTARLQNIKFYLVDDDSVNAFTTGKEVIFINSGFIKKFPDIDIIRGMIAHEVGHIVGKHVLRYDNDITDYKKALLSSVAIGLIGGVAVNPALATAGILGGMDYTERTVLKHSRMYEASADQYALKSLEQTKNSAIGLIKLLEYFYVKETGATESQYFLTHPLSKERLATVQNFYAGSSYKKACTNEVLSKKLKYAVIKLEAFTEDPNLIINKFVNTKNALSYYALTIAYFRNGNFSQANEYIDRLIKLDATNPYYYELKGQIYFEFGKKDSVSYYRKSAEFLPKDPLIRLSKGIVGMSVNNQPHDLHEFYKDLMFVSESDPENFTAMYYLTVYYEKIGNTPKKLLSLAAIAMHQKDYEKAKKLAQEVLKEVKLNTPDWYKATDIIESTQSQLSHTSQN